MPETDPVLRTLPCLPPEQVAPAQSLTPSLDALAIERLTAPHRAAAAAGDRAAS
jgi:hypothetical protein